MTKAETRHSGSYSVIWGRWCLYNTNCVMWESATFGETQREYSHRLNQNHGGRHVYLNKTIILWHSCAAVSDWMQSMKGKWHDKRMRFLFPLLSMGNGCKKNEHGQHVLENADIFYFSIIVNLMSALRSFYCMLSVFILMGNFKNITVLQAHLHLVIRFGCSFY